MLVFPNPPTSDMDYRICNVRTNVNACNFTWGFTNTVRESALKVDSGRKIPRRTGESNLHQRRDGSTLYQLSYVSTRHVIICVTSRYFHPGGECFQVARVDGRLDTAVVRFMWTFIVKEQVERFGETCHKCFA